MEIRTERPLLQGAIIVGCAVPLLAGGAGMAMGAELLTPAPPPPGLDSHFRYLSGLLLGIGIGFLTCVPRIEAQGPRIRLLAACVVIGGLARAFSLLEDGWPGLGHQIALAMELGVVPVLVLWQRRLAIRWRRSSQD